MCLKILELIQHFTLTIIPKIRYCLREAILYFVKASELKLFFPTFNSSFLLMNILILEKNFGMHVLRYPQNILRVYFHESGEFNRQTYN